MTLQYEKESLWARSIGHSGIGYDQERQRLRTEFTGFRSRVGTLLEKIRSDFPDLTIHDLSHIDELWRIASLLAGEEYPINPLEAFVLGGAFLLHDAALCFEAYDGGQIGVRSTIAWRDAFALESKRCPDLPTVEREERADFSAVRDLHASQSAILAERNWNTSGTGDPVYLIGDFHIRQHLGRLMGEIAASHHQSIEQVYSVFSSVFNAPSEFPSEWQVDSVKLACLLRCADALHVDNKRAPDFLHAIRQRSGISRDHWLAQNWLARPALDPQCPKRETVLVTSTRPFPMNEANAWWVACDALSVANKEIESSNHLLKNREGSLARPFQVKRIRGCDRLDLLTDVIRTAGWSPCSASLHVSNVQSLIASLGGEKLYGPNNEVGVSLRELIQNARDAICARRAIERDHEGEIIITYTPETHTLTVDDDGIGMSERVLTGPLLGFGTSFWASDLVRSEFPGLVSSAFQSSGRFGLGFFSIFMAAESARVSSRRYDHAYSSTATIAFPHGLTLRPVLSRGQIEGFRRSTRVSLKLKPELMADSRNLVTGKGFGNLADSHGNMAGKSMSLAQYLGSLCASLDVCVSFAEGNTAPIRLHSKLPINSSEYESWLRRLLFADVYGSTDLDQYLKKHSARLRPIMAGDKQIGLAAISARDEGPGMPPLGRLTAGLFPYRIATRTVHSVLGFIETGADSAQRDPKSLDGMLPDLKSWAHGQLGALSSISLNEIECFHAASGLAHFGVDSRQLAKLPVLIDSQTFWFDFAQIVDLLQSVPIAFYKSTFGDWIEQYCSFTDFRGAALIRIPGGGWNSLKFGTDGTPVSDFSIIDFIHRTAAERGMNIRWETLKNVRTMDVFGAIDAVIASST
jgi:hypothetical protein